MTYSDKFTMWLTIYHTIFYNAKYVLKCLNQNQKNPNELNDLFANFGQNNLAFQTTIFIMVNGGSRDMLAMNLIDH